MLKGKAFTFGHDVDTDAIIPARYLITTDAEEMAKHCMEDSKKPDFAKQVRPGDIMVAGKNFGCGSSREHAPRAIKGCRVSCVIAENFARIFFRNSINIGLPILECPQAAREIQDGHEVEVDLESGQIVNKTTGENFSAEPFPEFMRKIVAKGGLMELAKEMLSG